MPAVILNPGTEPREGASVENAIQVAKRIAADLELPADCFRRDPDSEKADGWYSFLFNNGHRDVEVDIPGDDPDEVCKSEPWVSRRLYVDGSSWLYGYALKFIAHRDDEDEA